MRADRVRPEDIFQCRRCGDCCKGYGGTYLTPADIEAISSYIGMDSSTFEARYCVLSGGRPLLGQAENGYCVFWDGLCTIHPVKPRMCRQWPFLESVLVDVANWKAMASCCPGMRTDLPDETILAGVRAQLGIAAPDSGRPVSGAGG